MDTNDETTQPADDGGAEKLEETRSEERGSTLDESPEEGGGEPDAPAEDAPAEPDAAPEPSPGEGE